MKKLKDIKAATACNPRRQPILLENEYVMKGKANSSYVITIRLKMDSFEKKKC